MSGVLRCACVLGGGWQGDGIVDADPFGLLLRGTDFAGWAPHSLMPDLCPLFVTYVGCAIFLNKNTGREGPRPEPRRGAAGEFREARVRGVAKEGQVGGRLQEGRGDDQALGQPG